jgi:hypothetical protein
LFDDFFAQCPRSIRLNFVDMHFRRMLQDAQFADNDWRNAALGLPIADSTKPDESSTIGQQ